MPTSRLGLPTITGNMTNDVVRDLNALAEAVDEKVAPKDATNNLATKDELTNHADVSASITKKGHVQLSNDTNSTSEVLAATPKAVKGVKDSVSNVNNYGVATQVEAETGTSDVKYMTPLKVKQAVAKFTPKNAPNGYAGLDENGNVVNSTGKVLYPDDGSVEFARVDLAVNPANGFTVSGLENYKDVSFSFDGVGSSSTTIQGVNVYPNGAVGSQLIRMTNEVGNKMWGFVKQLNNSEKFTSLMATGFSERSAGGIPYSSDVILVKYFNNTVDYRVERLKSLTLVFDNAAIMNAGIITVRGVPK